MFAFIAKVRPSGILSVLLKSMGGKKKKKEEKVVVFSQRALPLRVSVSLPVVEGCA